MKWLLQDMLTNPINVKRVQNALEETKTDYLLVKIEKDDSLVVLDKELLIPVENSKEILEEFIKGQKVMVYGTKKMSDIAKKMNLNPGSFVNDQFDFENLKERLSEELLNGEFSIGKLWELNPTEDEFFIRPTGNTKLFTGKVMKKEEFLEWQKEEKLKETSFASENLMISKVQKIKVEYRFFVVNQKIITYSSYAVEGESCLTKEPSQDLITYTEKMINKLKLADAFVIDTAETEDGFKIVEYNNINCSGLYNCDEVLFVKAINKMEKEKRKVLPKDLEENFNLIKKAEEKNLKKILETEEDQKNFLKKMEKTYNRTTEKHIEKMKRNDFEGNVDEKTWYRIAAKLKKE